MPMKRFSSFLLLIALGIVTPVLCLAQEDSTLY